MTVPSSAVRRVLPALLLASACASGAGLASSPRGPELPPLIVVVPSEPREQTADQQVQQVLNRLGYGARPGDVARVREAGIDQWIALQLAPERIDDGAAARIVASYELLGRPTRDFMTMYAEGQVAVRALQQQAAAQGDTTGTRERRAALLRNDPALSDRLRQNQRILGDVQSAKLARAVITDRQLQEVMTDFWENHFTVYAGKGITRFFIPSYDREVIRPRALGRFRDLLGAVAKSPAMLFFLDQWQSAADSLHPTLAASRGAGRGGGPGGRRMSVEEIERLAPGGRLSPDQRRRLAALTPEQRGRLVEQRVAQPQGNRTRGLNENYARELLELHTLGVDGGYTQHDVIDVARALTGWTMAPRQEAAFLFRPQIHDAGEKVVLGHRLPAGRGIEDGETVLDLVARDPHTARFIACKLAIRFVSDEPPAALVDRAAATFTRTDGDIREVVRTIVTSPEFFSRAAYRSKVKSPFELVASALRALGSSADTTLRSAQAVAFLGQPSFGHQAPDGWPETGDAWMNSGAILNRINFGLTLAAGRLPGASLAGWPEYERLRGASREAQVDGVVAAFLGGNASPDTRDILVKGDNPLAAKLATADTVPMSHRDGAAAKLERDMMIEPSMAPASPLRPRAARSAGVAAVGRPVQLTGLSQVVGLAIGAPEFQRR